MRLGWISLEVRRLDLKEAGGDCTEEDSVGVGMDQTESAVMGYPGLSSQDSVMYVITN